MKKNIYKFRFILFLFILLAIIPIKVNTLSYNSNSEYFLNRYDINIVVNENNTLNITEKIGAYFNIEKHGIFRKIPLRNEITRLDGTTSKNRAKISEIKVNDKYSQSVEDGYKIIKIGDKNYTFTGEKNYEISYLYNLGKDAGKGYDELYFNLIGDEWDTNISNITFTITMPKEFDASKLGFSAGKKGSVDNSKITYNVYGNVIKGSYGGILASGEALTVRTELPEGYFVNDGFQPNLSTYIFFIIPVTFLLISIFLWYKFGKDEPVIETVEFYPPERFNSLEIGYLYKGYATNKDIISLLIYLANKGYIKINETKTDSFTITKIKDYDGNNDNEKIFLDGLFQHKSLLTDSKLYTVTEDDLYNNFYKTIDKIYGKIDLKTNKKRIFDITTFPKILVIIFMILISLFTTIIIPTLEYANTGDLFGTIIMILVCVPIYALGLSEALPKIFRKIILGNIMFISLVCFCLLPIMNAILEERIFLIGFLLGAFCIVGMIVCLKAMPKRTKYGNEMLGKINGFKNFLETVEKEKLEAMVMQNPNYFYDILPFTYVLEISDKWIEKFETISLNAPGWYGGYSSFNTKKIKTFINNTMVSAQSVMSSMPSSSSSHSSGGGSSGGGSGGGGGGSW